jgi:hypothetical protein
MHFINHKRLAHLKDELNLLIWCVLISIKRAYLKFDKQGIICAALARLWPCISVTSATEGPFVLLFFSTGWSGYKIQTLPH